MSFLSLRSATRESLWNSRKAYWIDIRPRSVDEYRPVIRALLRAGRIQSENSFLLQAETRSAAVDAVGLGQLRGLNKDLGNILGIVDQASSSNVSAPSDIVVAYETASSLGHVRTSTNTVEPFIRGQQNVVVSSGEHS